LRSILDVAAGGVDFSASVPHAMGMAKLFS
jgi:hypothetical protein